MYRKFTFLLSVILFSQLLVAQDFVDQWYSEKYLPQNSVKSIAKDTLGFVWLATESGLARFDGKNFKLFNEVDDLSTNRFYYFYKRKDSLFAKTIYKDEVLITSNQVIKSDNHPYPNAEQLIKHDDILNKTGQRLNLVSENDFLIPLSNNRLALETNKINKQYQFEDEIELVINYKSSLYILTQTNLFQVNLFNGNLNTVGLERFLKFEYLPINKGFELSYLFILSQKALFINIDQNVYYFSIENNELNLIHNNLNFSEKNIITAYYDPLSKTSYFGSGYKGFLVSKPNLFTIYTADTPHYVQNLIYAFDILESDKILTSRGLLIDNQEVKNLKYISNINSLAFEKIDDLKYAQIFYNKILQVDYLSSSDPEILVNFSEDLGVLHFDKDKGLLYFTTKKFDSESKIGLYAFHFESKKVKKIASINYNVNIIDKYNSNQLYLGTENGAYFFDLSSEKLIPIEGTDGLNVRHINFKADYAWISTYNKGLQLKKDDTIYDFPVIRNQVSKSVHHAIEDDYGYLWVSTNNGLLRGEIETLLNEKAKFKHFFNYFDTNDGLLINEFNGGCKPCATKLVSGEILFPSLNGLVKFNPEDFLHFNDEVKGIKSRIYVNEEEFEYDGFNKQFIFPKNTQTIKVEFDYVKNNSVFDFYFSLNQAPNSKVTNDEIILNNLPSDDYLLELFLPEQSVQRKIEFSIAPKFFQTNQFKLLVLILVVLIVYLLLKVIIYTERRRSKQMDLVINEKTKLLKDTISSLNMASKDLEEKVASHKKIIASISHDIKSPLQYLKLGAEFLKQELINKNLGEEVEENIIALDDSIQKLQDFTENILAYSKAIINQDTSQKENFLVKELINDKVSLFDQVIKSKKINVKINIPDTLSIRTNKNLLAVIVHNILDNALKNTQKSKVTISCKNIFNKTILKIEDKGSGMDESTLSKYKEVFQNTNKKVSVSGSGLGLFIVAESARLLDADVEIESKKHEGTSFILTLKE